MLSFFAMHQSYYKNYNLSVLYKYTVRRQPASHAGYQHAKWALNCFTGPDTQRYPPHHPSHLGQAQIPSVTLLTTPPTWVRPRYPALPSSPPLPPGSGPDTQHYPPHHPSHLGQAQIPSVTLLTTPPTWVRPRYPALPSSPPLPPGSGPDTQRYPPHHPSHLGHTARFT